MRCKTPGDKWFLSAHKSKLGNIHNNNILFNVTQYFIYALLETVHFKTSI